MFDHVRLLLLQVRNADDPMRSQEIRSFSEALLIPPTQIRVHDLISGCPSPELVAEHDAVLIGGSGHYSATSNEPWALEAFAAMRYLYDHKVPTFASCWGFQAFARALGGEVVYDLNRAELGTHYVTVTDAAADDPLFRELGPTFEAAMGHEDCVDRLPQDAILLASTDRVPHQAFTFPDRLLYATQFHPELTRQRFLERVEAYPEYVEKISGLSPHEFAAGCRDTPVARSLLGRFLRRVCELS